MGSYNVRLLTYLDGERLTQQTYLSEPTMEAIGTSQHRLHSSLPTSSTSGLERVLQWDLRQAGPVAFICLHR